MAAPLSNELSKWFRDQSIRMRRTKWPSAHMLSDELFLIMSLVPDQTTGPLEAQPFGLNLPPIPFPSFNDLNIPPLDLSFLEFPELQRQPFTNEQPGRGDSGGRHITNTRQTTKRETVPGTIVSGSGDSYSVRVYPNGLNTLGGNYLNDGLENRDVDNITTSGVITAKHPQMDAQAIIPSGTWVWVWRLVQIEIIETTIYGIEGEVLSKSTSVNQTSLEDILMHPVWV